MAGTPHDPTALAHEPALAGEPALAHEPTQPGPAVQPVPPGGTDDTHTVTGDGDGRLPSPPEGYPPGPAAGPAGGGPAGGGPAGGGGAADQVVRYGPGVPALGSAGAAALTAEAVWRAGPPGAPRGRGRLRRLAGPALSVALLAASAVVIFLRLHHGPFGVTGVAITAQVRHGCTEDVTGRVGTTGAAGTVSYQWVFSPQATAQPPLSQSVASGQSALYVTAAVEGQGHGSLTQTVTLRVLGPGHGSASARVVLNC